jgi:probable HAF family extracellular repeat protein
VPIVVLAPAAPRAGSTAGRVAGCPGGTSANPVGSVYRVSRIPRGCVDVQYYDAGFACTAGRLTRRSRWALTLLPGTNTLARAINDRGQVVGYSSSKATAGYGHAFLWAAGKMRDLGTLGGVMSDARAVNRRGQVIGASRTWAGVQHATLWQAERIRDLGTLCPRLGTSAAVVRAVLWTLRSER